MLGVQNGSIAGTEGITFHAGDGSHDTDMDITSTLANLNLQLGRLPLGPKREPVGIRGAKVVDAEGEVDDDYDI